MVDIDTVRNKLRECYDPEIPINILDLGLVYDIQLQEDTIHIQMTLTAPHCPLAGVLAEEVKRKLFEIEGVKKVEVELVWDPPWTPDRISDEVKKTLGF